MYGCGCPLLGLREAQAIFGPSTNLIVAAEGVLGLLGHIMPWIYKAA